MSDNAISQIQVNDKVYDICDTEARNSINILKQRPIITTYVGSTNVSESAAWLPCIFNTIKASNNADGISNWYSFSDGIITANTNCILKISILGLWSDSTAGQRGLEIRAGSDVTSSNEYSSINYCFTNSTSWKNVVFPSRVFLLEANNSLSMGHWGPSGATFKVAEHTSGSGAPGPQSYATIEVVNL